METNRIRVLKNVQINGKWTLLPVPKRSNNKYGWDVVLNKGVEERHAEGNYHLDYYDNEGKRKRPSVGAHPADVLNEIRRVTLVLVAKDQLIELGEVEDATQGPEKTTLTSARDRYLKDVSMLKSKSSYDKYTRVVTEFVDGTKKAYVEEIERRDIMNFMAQLHEQGNGGRTIENKTIIVLTFLKTFGISKLLLKQDWPAYMNADKRLYEIEDLQTFFAVCNDEERITFDFFLNSGFRDREVRVFEYDDLDFVAGTVRVRAKSQWNFNPKGKEAREIPLPQSLLDALADRKKKSTSRLVFPSPAHWKSPGVKPGGKPSDHFLEMCKGVALRAGLNCGDCENSRGDLCAAEACCSDWTLHRFRHTYGTTMLRDGWDIETVATWMGHKDINTTREYLKAVHASQARHRISNGTLASLMNAKRTRGSVVPMRMAAR